MDYLKKSKSLVINRLAVPLALLLITVFAYGLLFWRLGLYWDDQAISWIRYQFGVGATAKYFSDSRPVWGLLYELTAYFLPLKPAYWQLFAMFWRWADALAFWLVLEKLFPRRKDIALLLALFVMLYPGFNQQWVSYLYAHFFIVFFFLLISWYLMLRGQTIPAMIFSALNLLMLEYFFLLEFIRPLFILKSLQDEPLTTRDRYLMTLKSWLPYLGVIVVTVLYRLLVFSHPGFGYSLTDELVRAPVETFGHLIVQIFSSLWVTAVAAWFQLFRFPIPSVVGMYTTIVYVAVVLSVGGLVYFFKRFYVNSPDTDNGRKMFWLIALGIILLVLGGVPYWITNLPVSLGFPANRATLSFMLGACFFLMGFLELFPVRIKYLAAVVLIALSAGQQFLWSMDYVRDWQSQKNFFWQMLWRAPGMEPGTIVLTNQQLSYSADNSIGAALNWIYSPDNHDINQVDYALFYPTNRLGGALAGLEPGLPVKYDYLVGQFVGNTSQVLAFYYSPPGCLRLLDPEIDTSNRFIPVESLMRDAAALSSDIWVLDRSLARMPEIYGPEPAHNWCYYFEQADLARQIGDWEQVADLGDKAFKLDDYPNDPIERFVFVEGYAHAGKWDKALEYSQVSYKVSKNYVGPLLCKLLVRIEHDVPDSPEKSQFITQAKTLFGCNP